ncbi:putative 2OG-Fe(II) oxygenase [Novosphingobium sp.]|uniref:putative 2OG-Fe(II) oxygenase n=1 Tax=Novosphingobium sp. TaxID=1874826 RepID=UPI00262D3C06|nr:putative 2OG-Fe(II) oxygenase [Novosphingobium sp.]
MDAQALLQRAVALRDVQDTAGALEAILAAAKLAPNDPNVALGVAQVSFEAGLPAADLYARAAQLSPARIDLQRSRATALAAEGRQADGEALLEQVLAANPAWIDGHRCLSGLRATAGDANFARSFAAAVARGPENFGLRMAWFHVLATAKDWDAARKVIADAETALGERQASLLGKLFIASESGEGADDPALFDGVESVRDVGLDLARVRHFLRGGQVERARDVCVRHMGTPAMRAFWSYLSLAWRLLGDTRADWLDGGMRDVRSYDLDFTPGELAELTETLRGLHTMQLPYHEQSVRGGTQTERPLLLRIDPVIAKAKAKIEAAVRDYIDGLPSADPAHPLLSAPRGPFLFAGSWSVRLRPGGFHSVHTHPMGWISSALYVSVPEAHALGVPPAGHLQFGAPPPELGLGLEPYGAVAPQPGRLALFPSTLWHGTVPFDDGERLTIAFDIIPHPKA